MKYSYEQIEQRTKEMFEQLQKEHPQMEEETLESMSYILVQTSLGKEDPSYVEELIFAYENEIVKAVLETHHKNYFASFLKTAIESENEEIVSFLLENIKTIDLQIIEYVLQATQAKLIDTKEAGRFLASFIVQ
ncbi:MAG: hypothetical protein N3A54_01535 [Patescibacteria group bacterium]|nr:hypothetical protein [Patescibacteria group bacterium]